MPLARPESIEETGALDIDVSCVNRNYQRILFHSVRTAPADRVPEMASCVSMSIRRPQRETVA